MLSRKSKVLSLSLSQGVLMIVHVLSGMVFARYLTVEDYGTYLQTFLAYDFAVPILSLGLPSAMYYFLPGEKLRQKGIVLDNIVLLMITSMIFSAFLYFGGTELLAQRFNNPELSKTLRWLVFYPLYTFPTLLASAVWVSKDKVQLNALYNVITGVILTVFLILSAILSKGYQIPVLVKVFIPVIFFPFTMYFIFKQLPGSWFMPDVKSMIKITKFALPLGLATIFGTMTIQLSSIIVSLLTTPYDFAVYANGAKEVPLVSTITGSIAVVIMADMSGMIKNGKTQSALELFRKSTYLSSLLLFPIMCFLLFYAEYFIEILYSNKYSESVIPFRIYLPQLIIRIVNYGAAFIAFGKTKAILYRSIIDLLLTGVFCYIFVLLFGVNGAALGLVLTLFIWTVPFNLYSLSKYFNCKLFSILPFYKLFRVLLISVISGIVSSVVILVNLNYIVGFILGALLFFSTYFLLSMKFMPEFKEMILVYFKKNLAK